MNKELLVNLIMTFIGGVVIVLLWPLIKWFAILAVVLVALAIAYTLIKAQKIKREIEKDPDAYYSQQAHTNKDVIDVEYKEKVVEEEK